MEDSKKVGEQKLENPKVKTRKLINQTYKGFWKINKADIQLTKLKIKENVP